MPAYKNLSGNSGVLAYEVNEESIKVIFIDGTPYVYSYKSAGKRHVEKMKKLAEAGKGLSTYISQHVKDRYDKG